MIIGEYIVLILNADAAFMALCNGRVFPLRAKQDSHLPRVVYSEVDQLPVNDFQGRTGLTKSRVQIDCYGTKYLEAHRVASHIHRVFDSRLEENPCSLFIVGRDLFDDEAEIYRVSLDFSFWLR